jgi:hypothetical protein
MAQAEPKPKFPDSPGNQPDIPVKFLRGERGGRWAAGLGGETLHIEELTFQNDAPEGTHVVGLGEGAQCLEEGRQSADEFGIRALKAEVRDCFWKGLRQRA